MRCTLLLAFLLPSLLAAQGTWTDPRCTLEYPEGWKVDTTGRGGAVVSFHTLPADSLDQFSENVNLMVQRVDDLPMGEYIRITEEQVTGKLKDGRLIYSEGTRLPGGDVHRFEYEGTVGEFRLHFLQTVRFRDGWAFLLTFTAEQDAYDTYLEEGQAILDSFAWRE